MNIEGFPGSLKSAVLLRPKMYTIGGTFEEIVAFLTGYYSGLALHNPYAPSIRRWGEFTDWLALQLGIEGRNSSETFTKLAAESAAPLEALANYLEEFEKNYPPEL